MSEQADFYTIRQTAELLDVPTCEVHGLLRKSRLKAYRHEETGRWLIDAHSVHGYLGALAIGLQETSSSTTAVAVADDATQGPARRFSDLLILSIIGGLTLLAAVYTLAPRLLGDS
jgi:hypothetical protein